jgi:hypothetical protein
MISTCLGKMTVMEMGSCRGNRLTQNSTRAIPTQYLHYINVPLPPRHTFWTSLMSGNGAFRRPPPPSGGMPGPRLPIELFPESDTPEFDGPNGVTPERPTGEGIDAAELDAERGTGSSLGGFFFFLSPFPRSSSTSCFALDRFSSLLSCDYESKMDELQSHFEQQVTFFETSFFFFSSSYSLL